MKKEITIKVKNETEIEKKIQLPYYSKSICQFWKIVSENEVHKIYFGSGGFEFEVSCHITSHALTETPSNEAEFNEAFELVLNKIKALK